MRQDDIRKEILLQLYAARPVALSITRIERDAKKGGYDYTRREITAETEFLAGDGIIIEKPMPGVTEKHYAITSAGIRHYEQTFA